MSAPHLQTVRVLMVEDVATEAELELRELKRSGMRLESRVVCDEQEFRSQIEAFRPDVILSDFSMPGWDGMSALATAREVCPETPFIFVSGTLGEEYAIRALKNGAVDYVLKTNLVRLPSAVERALHDARERDARRSAEVELDVARARLHSIFSTVDDVLWSVELPSLQVVYISPSAAALYGHSPEELIAQPALRTRLTHPQDAPKVAEAWAALGTSGRMDVEYRIVRPGGEVRWVHERAKLSRPGDPAAQAGGGRADGILRDITDRMEQHQRIARLSRVREVLSGLNAALVRLRNREALLDEACRVALEAGGFAAAYIGMADFGARRIDLAAARGDAPAPMFPIALERDGKGSESILVRAVRTGEPIIVNDWRGRDGDKEPHSLASLPIIVDGQAQGALVLRVLERDFFDQEEVRLLRMVAGNLSFGLELIGKQEQLNYLAYYDALTGLPNRTLFQDRLSQVLAGARSSNSMVALIVFDIERFKVINDSLGQHTGDRLLQLVAERLRAAAGDTHRLARLAGNQFTMLLPAVTDEASVVRALGGQASSMFEEPFDIDGKDLRIAAKAGIAVFPNDGADADTLFLNAEAALKRAKTSGEPYLFYAPQINARVAGRLELENKLRKAVQEQQFVLHYQPKVDLITGRITGLEALIRWQDPEAGLVFPGQFIGLLEETGLIQRVGRWAMEEAIRTYRDWAGRKLQPPRIAVNLSPLQLRQRDLVSDVRSIVSGDGEASGLDLEITESLLMQDVEESIAKLRDIRDSGIRISVDDFGTGYSSLSYIHKLPIDLLKIDRSFINGMTEDSGKTSIVSTIISLAQSLRLKVVAEGVETEQQAQLLRLLRCDQMQGFLFSKALPREGMEAMLAAQAGA